MRFATLVIRYVFTMSETRIILYAFMHCRGNGPV
jgi:hypothetical protein